MKRLLFFIAIIKISLFCISQEIITSSGDFAQDSAISVSWSLGEYVTETFTDPENIITQGFQQSNYSIITLVKSPSLDFGINVFPVPATDYIEIKIIGKKTPDIILSLIDIYGNILVLKNVVSYDMRINVESLSSGIYILKAIDKNGKILRLFRIVKP